MGKTNKRMFASYRAMPQQSRFWVYSQSCYTPEDLEFREWVIKTRANSGIHTDYLNNPSSWFTEDSQALIDVYPNSWIFSSAYRPRQTLSREDFHVQPIDALRLNWPSIYDLMQQTGDYLLLRNKDLSTDNFNQPMNYVLLDINHMLKGLSQNPNMEQVQEQLTSITKYVRTIEKHLSPMVGSDRLFLANFRGTVHEKIMPQIAHKIESRVLQDRLIDLGKIVQQVSSERNRILHFALNDRPVNPHPYQFSLAPTENLAAYPTQAAKACLELEPPLLTSGEPASPSSSKLASLKDCPHFGLVSSDEETTAHYQKAIEDLRELEKFQTIISETTGMLAQAGEVYTIHQFRVQMLGLLENINHFLVESSIHIDAIIDENTQAYHKAIQAQQDLSTWKKWFTSEEEQIKTFIKNQDTLAQFPSASLDLAKTASLAQANSREIIKHLEDAHSAEMSFKAVADKALELDKLMGSMHVWVTTQHQNKGLPAPQAPTPLRLSTGKSEKPTPLITKTDFVSSNPSSFFSTTATPSFDYCPSGASECPASPPQTTNSHALLALGLIIAIPTILYGLYLLFRQNSEPSDDIKLSASPSKRTLFTKYLTQFEDKIALLKGYEQRTAQDLSEDYQLFVDAYLESKNQAQKGHYDIKKIQEAYDDLSYFYAEYTESGQKAKLS
ncbi:hypothetical protein [Legionella sp. km772]|uniref:hypothetical protein n=1 Tax=Legionella sp. km772 TaxID=2498111 RepID=UPI000F8DCFF3|nr:hypothetical protein [Legionella sp. km772]RUR08417.1 hypothetical protein ELY15_10950 [Legionella sp. km772]